MRNALAGHNSDNRWKCRQATRLVRCGLALILVAPLLACVSGREKLAGPGVRTTSTATINVISKNPSIEVHDVASRDVTVRLLLESDVEAPKGVVILFAGGSGATSVSNDGRIGALGGNFLVRSRDLFRANGFITAVFDSPSDSMHDLRPVHGGSSFARDVAAVVRHLRQTYSLPVWVVGTSRGTVATANAASMGGPDSPDGAVFTSSLFEDSQRANVFDLPLANIRIPTLVVHHRHDGCAYTRPDGVAPFKAKLTGTRISKILWFDGGYSYGDECQARSYHGYNGIEDEVVRQIADWMKKPVAGRG